LIENDPKNSQIVTLWWEKKETWGDRSPKNRGTAHPQRSQISSSNVGAKIPVKEWQLSVPLKIKAIAFIAITLAGMLFCRNLLTFRDVTLQILHP